MDSSFVIHPSLLDAAGAPSREWVTVAVPGPWAVDYGSKEHRAGIINLATGKTTFTSLPFRPNSNRARIFAKARQQAEFRNRSLLANAKRAAEEKAEQEAKLAVQRNRMATLPAEFVRPWNTKGETWQPASVPGPWALLTTPSRSFDSIINIETGEIHPRRWQKWRLESPRNHPAFAFTERLNLDLAIAAIAAEVDAQQRLRGRQRLPAARSGYRDRLMAAVVEQCDPPMRPAMDECQQLLSSCLDFLDAFYDFLSRRKVFITSRRSRKVIRERLSSGLDPFPAELQLSAFTNRVSLESRLERKPRGEPAKIVMLDAQLLDAREALTATDNEDERHG